MALRLDDLKKAPTKAPVIPLEFSESTYESVAVVELAERPQTLKQEKTTLRPWQNLEDRNEGPRTLAAKEALAKARIRVERNEEQAKAFRAGMTAPEIEERLEMTLKEREKFFQFEKESGLENSKIRGNSPFVNFFRDLLRQ